MIGKLIGVVDSISQDHILINVAGVVYIVSCSIKTTVKLKVGESASLFIDTQMKESQIVLYGFADLNEKNSFLKLITIKGLGPKLALTILGALSTDQIYMSIVAKDKEAFCAISGVGNKIATRLFTELKADDFCFAEDITSNTVSVQFSAIKNDAISALVNLGINKTDAHTTVSKILLANEKIDLGELIRTSLSKING